MQVSASHTEYPGTFVHHGEGMWLALGVGLLLPLLCLWASHHYNRKRRLIRSLPTSKVAGVFIGLVELDGTAESEDPLRGFISGDLCVWYAYSVEEHWRRLVTETYRDSKGNTRTRTRVESGWTTVDSGGESQPFFMLDDTGALLIRPDGADIEPETVFSECVDRGHPLYYGKGPAGGVMHSTGERRFTEQALRLHGHVHIIGQARERTDIVAPEIAKDESAPMYLISVRDEAHITTWKGVGAWFWAIAGFAPSVGAAIWYMNETHAESVAGPVLAGVAYAFLWAATWVWSVYNALVDQRNRVNQGWSLIDVQLQRRSDLIPSMCAVIDGFKLHERTVQEHLAAMRGQSRKVGGDGSGLSALAPRIVAIAEAYPELKADALFAKLSTELIATENRIALAREYFNTVATHYNTAIGILPESLLASLAGMKPRDLLVANDLERAAVQVKFFDAR